MSLRINTNIAALSAQRSLDINQRQVESSLKKLSSGQRIVNVGDDAAGFAIAEGLKGQINSTRQAKQNAKNALSLVQSAEGGLNEQNNILIRLRELAVNSASDTVGEQERGFLDDEFQLLVSEFDRLAQSTRFGSKQLLIGDGQQFSFQVGAFEGPENIIQFRLDSDTRADTIGISEVDISDKESAADALDGIDEAVTRVSGVRARLGAVQSRFNFAIDNLSVQRENLEEARSNIADVDVAEEVANLTKGQVLLSMATSVLSQANQEPLRAVSLLNI